MVGSLIKGGLLAATIAFIWSMTSWMALPFHEMTVSGIEQEDVVAEAIRQSVTKPGMYNIPWGKNDTEAVHTKMARGPVAFMAILPQGRSPEMGGMMGFGLLLYFIVGMMATYVLLNTRGTSYIHRVAIFKLTAVTGVVLTVGSQWNWWGFSPGFALVEIIDAGIGWGLAGLVVAKVIKPWS